MRRLQGQRVPVTILPVDQVDDIERVYPRVKEYRDERYAVAKESGFGEDRAFRVLVDRNIEPLHVDAELDLPCFAASARQSMAAESTDRRR